MKQRAFQALSRKRYLAFILIVAAVLMSYGIWIRAPNAMGADEKTAVTKALWIGVHRTPYIPDFNKGGNFYLYVLAGSFTPYYLYLKLVGKVSILSQQASQASTFFDAPPELKQAFYDFLLAGRLTSVLVGIVTVYLVYDLGREIYTERTGVAAALIVTVSMGFVNTAHIATEDALLAGLITLTLLLLSKEHKSGNVRLLYAASITTGFAVSTKATAAFLVIPLIYTILPDRMESIIQRKDVLLGTSARLIKHGYLSLAAYLLTTPSILVYPEIYYAELLGESTRGFANNQYIDHPTWILQVFNLMQAYGLPLFILTIAGLGFTVVRLTRQNGTRSEIAIFLFVIPYTLLIGVRDHVWFVIPLMPILAIFTGKLVDYLIRRDSVYGLTQLIVTGILLFSVVYTGITVHGFANDARVESAEWFEENTESPAEVDVYQYPLHLPAFPDGFEVNQYWFNNSADDKFKTATKRIRCGNPEYIVLSSAQYAFFIQNPRVDPKVTTFYRRLLNNKTDYKEVAVFGPPIKYPNSLAYQFRRSIYPRTITNHDLRIIVFRRQGPSNDSTMCENV